MANFQRRDDALKGYVSDIDVEQYGKVLIGLQAGYDKNVGELTKVDMQLKKIADTQLLNQEAKDYFFTRMRERKDVLEKNMGNFAHANELDYGMKTLYSAIDDTVATEIYNSSIPSTIQEQYKKFADSKNPQLANSVNLEYSMKDIGTWLNTKGHLGKRFQGNSTYVPFVDVMKTINDEVKKVEPNAFATATENGFKIETLNGEMLSPARVKEIVDMAKASNPQIAKQIEVNAWNNYRGEDDNSFLIGAKNKIAELVNSYEMSAEEEKKSAYTSGASMLGESPITQSAKRSHIYDSNAAKFYKRILLGEDGKSGLMAMNKLDAASRARLETLLHEEKIKGDAANSFAYTAIKKADIKLNEAAAYAQTRNDKVNQFNLTYAQEEKKIGIDDFQAQTARIKALKELNPNATYEDLVGGGVSPQLASTVINPNSTYVEPSNIPKTDDIDETVTKVEMGKNDNIKELSTIAYNIAVIQNKTPEEIKNIQQLWNTEGKTQEQINQGLKEHHNGLLDALKNKKDITPTEAKLIKDYNEKLKETTRKIRTLNEFNEAKKDVKWYQGVQIENPIKGSDNHTINSERFKKTSGSAGILGLQDAYIDNVTGNVVSTFEAKNLSFEDPKISSDRFVKKRVNTAGLAVYEDKVTKEEVLQGTAIKISEEDARKGSLFNFNQKARKNGLLLKATDGVAYVTTDVNVIANALKYTTDKELADYKLTDIKDIKEQISNVITKKESKDFPISEMRVKEDGTITLIKKDGNTVAITNAPKYSTISQFASNVVEQQVRQDKKLTKSIELIADARLAQEKNSNTEKKGALIALESINGKKASATAYFAPVGYNGEQGKMHVEISYIDENGNQKKEIVADNNGETLMTVSDDDYKNVNLYENINILVSNYMQGLKIKSDKLKMENGRK